MNIHVYCNTRDTICAQKYYCLGKNLDFERLHLSIVQYTDRGKCISGAKAHITVAGTPANVMEEISLGPASTRPQLQDDVAVMIRDAVKIYGNTNVVLRNLNMTVPKGKM